MPAILAVWSEHVSDAEVFSLTDAELLRQSATGDSGAFEVFVARHRAWLFRHARALSADRAEETLQDAFVDAWRGAAPPTRLPPSPASRARRSRAGSIAGDCGWRRI
jgi:hypothetical protein